MYIDKSAVGVTGAGIHVPSEIKTLKHVFANDKRYRIIYGHFALFFFYYNVCAGFTNVQVEILRWYIYQATEILLRRVIEF